MTTHLSREPTTLPVCSAGKIALLTNMLNVSVDCIKVINTEGCQVLMNRAGCEALGVLNLTLTDFARLLTLV